MAQQKDSNVSLDMLKKDIDSGNIGNLYVLHGEERYLLERYLNRMREEISTGDFDDFNFKRFDGASLSLDELLSAADALPVFAERTFIEVHDFDIFRRSDDEKAVLIEMFSDIPEYVCIVFVYDTIEFKVDGRKKINGDIKKYLNTVEFVIQEQSKLVKWIKSHFTNLGKRISTSDAEYLTFITGGFMTSLSGEIEKVSAFCKSDTISRADIDSVVIPVLDAVIFRLSDAISQGNFKKASEIMDDLLRMREVPHKIIYSITQKLRQLLTARVCLENKLGKKELMEISNCRYEFQAKSLMASAKQRSLSWCKKAVLLSAETAFSMNSSGEKGETLLVGLLIDLSAIGDAQ